MNRVSLFALFASPLVLGACSSIEVRQIDHATGLKKDGLPEGVHYYMPWPTIVVNEPFVVASETYLARGELTPDSNYVLITDVPDKLLNQGLASVGRSGMGALAVPSSTVFAMDSVTSGGPQGAPAGRGKPAVTKPSDDQDKGATGDQGKGDADKNKDADKTENGDKSKDSTDATMSNKVIADMTAPMVTPVSRYFSVAWFPDLDQEYVISTKQGLGKSSATIKLLQGWALGSLEATVDNSAINKAVTDLIGVGEKLVTSKITAPVAAITGSTQGAPADRNKTAAKFTGGTPVTVKITLAHVAVPGWYKVLKPSEMRDENGKQLYPPGTLFAPDTRIPNVPFKTYDTFVIEAARATGDDAFQGLQNTETTNAANKLSVGAGNSDGVNGNSKTAAVDGGGSDSATQRALNNELLTPARSTTNGEHYVAKLAKLAGVYKVVLTKATGGPNGALASLPTDSAFKDSLVQWLDKHNVVIDAANVSFAP